MAAKIRWLSVREVYAFHDLALSEHGGKPGLRDAGLLESAVLRPKTAYAYGTSDLAELAAKLRSDWFPIMHFLTAPNAPPYLPA
jgi:prophage maintenance system killer protein